MEASQKPHVVAAAVDDVGVLNESSHRHHHQSDDEGKRSSSQPGSCNEIVKERGSSVSEVDLEHGTPQIKLHLAKVEMDCRICHLSFDEGSLEAEVPIELGCSCKDDLAAAHKQCAEAWFKIKGNKTCEICGSIARNVAGANETELVEQWNQASHVVVAAATVPTQPAETRNFWPGHRGRHFLSPGSDDGSEGDEHHGLSTAAFTIPYQR
ncbi:hypothetical protein OIU77_013569 [Salix suchowensis]|uniref:RING-CH-type domain-containing protein n=1 Tax=Salix suchowensis TaxID=1278906 RepID=A0ABQ8ZUN4_9ROSI|nr:hypothetical protein OIU77_013569 [Salix suchowensis]